MKTKDIRQSNFELMRIISMLMIIIGHILMHGKIIANATGTLRILIIFIQALIYIHVNSFVLVTGYFRCETRFKFSKVIQLNNSMWFYKALIPIILIFLGIISLDTISFLKLVSPFSHGDYWFITTYIYLYLISPILNIVINNINKTNYKRLLALLFIIFSIFPYISNQEIYNTRGGYNLLQFIILYFIGAYFKKYKIQECHYFKKFTPEAKKTILILTYLSLGLVSGFITLATSNISGGPMINYLSGTLNNAIYSYNNPFIIIQSICYFLFFSLLSIKNRVINTLSSTTLGVYLIHDNNFIREYLYKILGFQNISYSSTILVKVFLCSLLIFILCSIIELLRKLIFNFLYNRKFSQKLRSLYRNYLESFGLKINW